MICYVTYSNDLYAKSRDFGAKMALRYGKVDKVIVYKPEDIDCEFYEKNKSILDNKVGNGYWLWKPYFVKKALSTVEDGDIVLYCDAASFMFKDCRTFLDFEKDDIWVSNIPLIEKQFTKPELIKYMGCEDKKYTDTNQIQANFIALKKTERSVRFVTEWLEIAETGDNLLPNTIYENNPPEFKFEGHRSDQSILSLLSKKWKVEPHQDPTQFGRVPQKYYSEGWIYRVPDNQGEYKPSIILHRMKKIDYKYCIKMWIGTWIPMFIINGLYRKKISLNER